MSLNTCPSIWWINFPDSPIRSKAMRVLSYPADITQISPTYMTQVGFPSIVWLRLRAFGAQPPSESQTVGCTVMIRLIQRDGVKDRWFSVAAWPNIQLYQYISSVLISVLQRFWAECPAQLFGLGSHIHPRPPTYLNWPVAGSGSYAVSNSYVKFIFFNDFLARLALNWHPFWYWNAWLKLFL